MKKTAIIATLVFALGIAGPACKSGETPATQPAAQPASQPAGGQPGATPTIAPANAPTNTPVAAPAGGGKVSVERPGDIPLFAGGKITSETKTEHLYTVTYSVNAPVDTVKQFYQKTFETGGWTSKADPVAPSPAGAPALNMPIVMARDNRVCSVYVGQDEAQNTIVTIRLNR